MNLSLGLEHKGGVFLHETIFQALKASILEGRLQAGQQLPSTRQLAATLCVSRQTAIRCYERLLEQGLIETKAGSKTFVSPSVARTYKELAEEAPKTQTFTNSTQVSGSLMHDSMIPRATWNKCLQTSCESFDLLKDAQNQPGGCEKLRRAVSGYLCRARGVVCSADQVIVCGSAELARSLIATVMLSPGDCAAVENPGFEGLRLSITARGASLLPVPVDQEGMDTAYLRNSGKQPKAIYVTPAHQDPLGMPLSEARRQELLQFAQASSSILVEDDFDSEFFYGSPPPLALHSYAPERVIYMNCFWKVLFPLSSLAFIVVPPHLIAQFIQIKEQQERHFSVLEQLALARFIEDRYLDSTIRRTKLRYQRNRQALIFELKSKLKEEIEIARWSTGTSIVTRFAEHYKTAEIQSAAEYAGLLLTSSARYYMTVAPKNEFLIAFNADNPDVMCQAANRFVQQLTASRQ